MPSPPPVIEEGVVEELHATIAAYLRGQRQRSAVTREGEGAILGIWRERCAVPRCKVCGAPVDDDDGGLYNLQDMRQMRQCARHYIPF